MIELGHKSNQTHKIVHVVRIYGWYGAFLEGIWFVIEVRDCEETKKNFLKEIYRMMLQEKQQIKLYSSYH